MYLPVMSALFNIFLLASQDQNVLLLGQLKVGYMCLSCFRTVEKLCHPRFQLNACSYCAQIV